MSAFFYSLDVGFFRWVNEGWSNPILDGFFSFITDYKHFLILIVPWLLLSLLKGGSKGRWLVGGLFLALLIADQTSAHLIKPLVQRIRPCNALEGVLTPAGKSSAFSFPSSHATNLGAAMLLLSLAYRRWAWAFMVVALLVGLSRIYLGLHYPSDVLGGYALGLLAGFLVWRVTRIGQGRFGKSLGETGKTRSGEPSHG